MANHQKKIEFNPELFNNIYWHLKKAFENPLIRFIWVYGGSSASKTFSVVQLQVFLMLTETNQNAMIMRKVSTDIRDSIYKDFTDIINDWGLSEYFVCQQNYILCTLTGSYCRFRGLDDSEKVKGIKGFKRVILEEVNQFDYEDLKQIRKRLRGMVGQQIVGIFNPVSEEHWIKKQVFDLETLIEHTTDIYDPIPESNIPISGMWLNEKGNLTIFKTNYLDNVYIVGKWKVNKFGQLVQTGGFLDQHVIDDFEQDKIKDFNYYQIYGLGNWGKIRTGGEFWKDFNANIHTTKIGWDEEKPIFMSWDENINPHITCLLWQIHIKDGKKTAIQIDEICLLDPNNRVISVCNEFAKRYPIERVKGLFVGGDRTSMKEDTKMEKGQNFFTKILEHLKPYRPTLRIQSVNPSVVQSGGFINNCYSGRTNIEILINERCKKSLFDYQYALEDSDGTLKKSKKTNPITKVSYEEFGHCSDCKRYFITTNFADEYMTYIKGGRTSKPTIGKNISRNTY
jgi:PBSX family phage terminase large subunit